MTDEELKQLFESTTAEMRRQFDATVERIEKLDTTVERIEKKVDESTSQTRHQIGLAREATKHDVELVAELALQSRQELGRARAALDSQRALEETVANLQARVQRLETTH